MLPNFYLTNCFRKSVTFAYQISPALVFQLDSPLFKSDGSYFAVTNFQDQHTQFWFQNTLLSIKTYLSSNVRIFQMPVLPHNNCFRGPRTRQ